MRRIAAVFAAVVLAGVGISLAMRDRDPGPQPLMCPAPDSGRVFGDARDACASRATALASIDGRGRLTAYVDVVGCDVPDFAVVSTDVTRVLGRGSHRCDTDSGGTMLYLFPHCSLVMNYPGSEDYHPGRPIGLLVDPYDC
jgi:hypothetical protein